MAVVPLEIWVNIFVIPGTVENPINLKISSWELSKTDAWHKFLDQIITRKYIRSEELFIPISSIIKIELVEN